MCEGGERVIDGGGWGVVVEGGLSMVMCVRGGEGCRWWWLGGGGKRWSVVRSGVPGVYTTACPVSDTSG